MIHVGTSGWIYGHWEGIFYPEDLSQGEYLPFYADSFSTVEINNTFYRLPEAGTVENWEERAPEGFLFAVKANRYITHMKNLLDPEEPVERMMDRIRRLEDKLGPILFQLPPQWNVNAERLRNFVAVLPEGYQHVFEFRNSTWYTEEVYEILEESGCGFCIHDSKDAPAPQKFTADFTYVRFHGSQETSGGKYRPDHLQEWAEKLAAWEERGLEVYAYFNNDWQGFAIENARELKERLEGM